MANEKLMKGDVMEFASNMKKLLNNKDHSDVKFLIGQNRKPVYAHRCILSSRCAVFKATFAEQTQKNGTIDKDTPFVLSDMSADIFMAMLEFIYTNCVTLTPKIAIEVLATALEYGLDDLRRLCCEYLEENLSIQNACDCMQAAVTYGQEDLKEKVLIYIEQHTESVFKSKAFQELSEDALAEVLKIDGLGMDEAEIIKYVKEWAAVNSVVLGRPVADVAKNVIVWIRLPILTPDEIEKLEKDNKKDNIIPVELFSTAWRFHALNQPDPNNERARKRIGTQERSHHKNLNG
ncbi:BTB/POZ domain-containing protein 19-like [Mya arenaria]|uniref:BTB/POZ domain-containing protein 19-like n=1 Tax=Mya arenaria TaxID=6604 RepID=UPI0022E7BFEC|nr:BTB/POZ domain-containing protein 19-like [Mya arenaria]